MIQIRKGNVRPKPSTKIDEDARAMAERGIIEASTVDNVKTLGAVPAGLVVTDYTPSHATTAEVLTELHKLRAPVAKHQEEETSLFTRVCMLGADYVHLKQNADKSKATAANTGTLKIIEGQPPALTVDFDGMVKTFKTELDLATNGTLVKAAAEGKPTRNAIQWLNTTLKAAIKGGFLLQARAYGVQVAWFQGREIEAVNYTALSAKERAKCHQSLGVPYNRYVRSFHDPRGARMPNTSTAVIKLAAKDINNLFWAWSKNKDLEDNGSIPQEQSSDKTKADKLAKQIEEAIGKPDKMTGEGSIPILETFRNMLSNSAWRKTVQHNESVLNIIAEVAALLPEVYDAKKGELILVRASEEERQQDKVAAAIAERDGANRKAS